MSQNQSQRVQVWHLKKEGREGGSRCKSRECKPEKKEHSERQSRDIAATGEAGCDVLGGGTLIFKYQGDTIK